MAEGYYTFTEAGSPVHLGIADGRFLLVADQFGALDPAAAGELMQRGDSVFLVGEGVEARGRIRDGGLELEFEVPPDPILTATAATAGPLAFERSLTPAPEAGTSQRGERDGGVAAAAPAGLPITFWYWFAATIPMIVLVVTLVGLHWNPAPAAAASLFTGVVIAFTLYEMPLHAAAVATGKAIWDALFVMYIVWPALVLYSVIKEAKAFQRIEAALERFINSRLLLILAVAWAFSSFIQGIVGEGVPLAITIPIMIQLGVRPVYAVALPLIGRTWGNVFGGLGEGWLIVTRVAEIPDPTQAAVYGGILLIIPDLLAGLTIAWIYGRWWAIKRGALAIGVIALIHSGVQLALAVYYPLLAGFVAALLGLFVVFGLAKWGPYTEPDQESPDNIFKSEEKAVHPEEEDVDTEATEEEKRMSLWTAFAPYLALLLLSVVILVITPVREFLSQFKIGFPYPGVETPLGITREPTAAYAAFDFLTHPGTLIILATAFTWILYRSKGLFDESHSTRRILTRAGEESLPATTPFVALVLLAKVMELSGMVLVLALGMAVVSGPAIYAFLSPWIGGLGAFVTDSTSASLVLFTPLQATVARALDIPVALTAAGQMAGAATGNVLAALDILIGLLVIGRPDLIGRVLKIGAIWALIGLTLVGFGTLLLYWIG